MTTEQQQQGQITNEDAQRAAEQAIAAEEQAQQQAQSQGDQQSQEGQQDESPFLDHLATFVDSQQDEQRQAEAQQQAANLQLAQAVQLIGKIGKEVTELRETVKAGQPAAEEPLSVEMQAFNDMVNDPEMSDADRATLQKAFNHRLTARKSQQAQEAVIIDPDEIARKAAEETARRMMPQPPEWTREDAVALVEYGKGISEGIDLNLDWTNPNVREGLVANVPVNFTAEQAKPILKQNLVGLKARLQQQGAGGDPNAATGLETGQNRLLDKVPPSSTQIPGDNTAQPQSDEEVMSAFMAKDNVIPPNEFYDALSTSSVAKMRELIAKY